MLAVRAPTRTNTTASTTNNKIGGIYMFRRFRTVAGWTVSATMRRRNDFRLLPLNILATQDCMIENIFLLTSQRDEARVNFLKHGTSNNR